MPALGVEKGFLFRGVSSVQRLKEWYLGQKNVSCLGCPYRVPSIRMEQ